MNILNITKSRVWLKVVNFLIVTTFIYSSGYSYALPVTKESKSDTLAVRDCATYLKNTEHSIEEWKVIALGIIKELEKKREKPEDIEEDFKKMFGSMLDTYGVSGKINYDITIARDEREKADDITLNINGDDIQLGYKGDGFIPRRDKDAELIRRNSPEVILNRIAEYKDDFIGNEVYGEYLIFLLDLSIKISGMENKRKDIFASLYERTNSPIIHRLLESSYGTVSHRAVNQYIRENLPDTLIKDRGAITKFKLKARDGYNARIIPIVGLLANTGQLAHIGLGTIYGMPVIYVDTDYETNSDVLAHEFYEIRKWEEKRLSLKKEPGEMRQWIRDNYKEAVKLALTWHKEAPSVDHLLIQHRRATGSFLLASILDIYPRENDVNLGAGKKDLTGVQLGQLDTVLSVISRISKEGEGRADYTEVVSEIQRALSGKGEASIKQDMTEEGGRKDLGIDLTVTRDEITTERLKAMNEQLRAKLENVKKVMNGLLAELKGVVAIHEEDGLFKTIILKVIDSSIKKMESTSDRVNILISRGHNELKQGNGEKAYSYYTRARDEVITALKQTQNAGKGSESQLKEQTKDSLVKIRDTAKVLEEDVGKAFIEFFKEVFPVRKESGKPAAGLPSGSGNEGVADHDLINAELISKIDEALDSTLDVLESVNNFITDKMRKMGFQGIKFRGLTLKAEDIMKELNGRFLESRAKIEKAKENSRRLIEIAGEELTQGDRNYAYIKYRQSEALVLNLLVEFKGNINIADKDFGLLSLAPAIKDQIGKVENDLNGHIEAIGETFKKSLNTIFADMDKKERERLEQELLTENARIKREELKLPKASLSDRFWEPIEVFFYKRSVKKEIKKYLEGDEIIKEYESDGDIPLELSRKLVFMPLVIKGLKNERDEKRLQALLWLLAKMRKELRNRVEIKYMLNGLPYIKEIVTESKGRYSDETKVMALQVLMSSGHREYFTGYKINGKDIKEFLFEFASRKVYRLDERHRIKAKEIAMRILLETGTAEDNIKLYSLLDSDDKAVRVVLLRAIKDYYVPEQIFDKLIGFVLDEEEIMEVVRPSLLIIREKASEKAWEKLFSEMRRRNISEERMLFIIKGMYYADPSKTANLTLPFVGIALPIMVTERKFTLKASIKPLMDVLCSPVQKFTHKFKGELIEAILKELGRQIQMNEFFDLLFSIINTESAEYAELRKEENRPVLRDIIDKVLKEKDFSERKADASKGEDVMDIIEKLKILFSQYKEEESMAVAILYTMRRLAYNHSINIDDYAQGIYEGDYKPEIKTQAVWCFTSGKLKELFLDKKLKLPHMMIVVEILEGRGSTEEVNALLIDERFTSLHKVGDAVKDAKERENLLYCKNSFISGLNKDRVDQFYRESMHVRARNVEEDFFVRANAYRKSHYTNMIGFIFERLSEQDIQPEEFMKIIGWVKGFIESPDSFSGQKDNGWYFDRIDPGDKEIVINKLFDFVEGNFFNIICKEADRGKQINLIDHFKQFFYTLKVTKRHLSMKRSAGIILNEKYHDDIRSMAIGFLFGHDSNVTKLFHASRNPPDDSTQPNHSYKDNEFVKEFLNVFVEDGSIYDDHTREEIMYEVEKISEEIVNLLKTPNNPFIRDNDGNFRLIKIIKRLKGENRLRLVKVVLAVPGGIGLFDEFCEKTNFIFRLYAILDSFNEKYMKARSRPLLQKDYEDSFDMLVKDVLIQYGKYDLGQRVLMIEALGQDFVPTQETSGCKSGDESAFGMEPRRGVLIGTNPKGSIFSLVFTRIMDFVNGYVKNKKAAMFAHKYNQISEKTIDSIITALSVNEELTIKGLELDLCGDELVLFAKGELSEDSVLKKKKDLMQAWKDGNREKTKEEKRIQDIERIKKTLQDVYGFISSDNPAYKTVKRIFENIKKASSKELGDIFLVDSPSVNAFIMSGDNNVYFYLGLLAELARYAERHNFPLTEDMIAFVIAHEVTHIEQGILPEDIPEEIKNDTIGERLRSLTREMEYDADKGAVRSLMVKAGYNPREAIKILNFFLSAQDTKISITHPRSILRTLEVNELVESPEEVMHTDREPKKIQDEETLKSMQNSERHVFDSGFRAGSLGDLMRKMEETEDVMTAADLIPQAELVTEYLIAKNEAEEDYVKECFLRKVFIDNLWDLIIFIAGQQERGVGTLQDNGFDMMYYCNNQNISGETAFDCNFMRDSGIRNAIKGKLGGENFDDFNYIISTIKNYLDNLIKGTEDPKKKSQLNYLKYLLSRLEGGYVTFTPDDFQKAIEERPAENKDMGKKAVKEIDAGNTGGVIEILKTNLMKTLLSFTAKPGSLALILESRKAELGYESRREMENLPINTEDFEERFYKYDSRNPDFTKQENRRKIVETLLLSNVFNAIREIKRQNNVIGDVGALYDGRYSIWSRRAKDSIMGKLKKKHSDVHENVLQAVAGTFMPSVAYREFSIKDFSDEEVDQLFDVVTGMDYVKRYYISPIMKKEGILPKNIEDIKKAKDRLLRLISDGLAKIGPNDPEAFKKYENQVITAIDRWGRYIESVEEDADKFVFLNDLFLNYLDLAQKNGRTLLDVLPIVEKFINDIKLTPKNVQWANLIGILANWKNTPGHIKILVLDLLVPEYARYCAPHLINAYFSMSPAERDMIKPEVHLSFLKKIACSDIRHVMLNKDSLINIDELLEFKKYIDDKLLYFFKKEILAKGREFKGDAFVDMFIEYYKLKDLEIEEFGNPKLINSKECYALLMELNSSQLERLIQEMRKAKKSIPSETNNYINRLFILRSIQEKYPKCVREFDLSDLKYRIDFSSLLRKKLSMEQLVQILERSLFDYYDIEFYNLAFFKEISSDIDISKFGRFLAPIKRGNEYKSRIDPPQSPYPDFTTAVNTKEDYKKENAIRDYGKIALLEEYMGTKPWKKKSIVEKADYIIKSIPEKCLYKDLLFDELEEEIFPSLKGKRTMIERRDAMDLNDIKTSKQAENAVGFYKKITGNISNEERRIRYASTAHRIYLEKLDGNKESFSDELNLILELYVYADYERDDVLTDLTERKGKKAVEDMVKAEKYYSINQKTDYTTETLDKSSIFERTKEILEQANRKERVELLLWLMGIRKEHPTHIVKILPTIGMDFGSIRGIVASLSPSAKKRIYMHVLRGENGLFESSIEHALMFIKNKIAGGEDYTFSSDSDNYAELMFYFLDRVFDSFIDEEAVKSLGDTEDERNKARRILRSVFLSIFAAYSPSRRMNVYLHLLDLHNKVKDANLGKKLATVLTAMGAAGVKAGQYLSEQEDLIKDKEIRKELAYLKGEVEPLTKRGVMKVIEDSGLREKLKLVNGTAGTASIKQVQNGIYENGRDVSIGVVKPQVMKFHAEDMFVIGVVSDILDVFYNIKLPNIRETVDEQIRGESNLKTEAENQELIRKTIYDNKDRYKSSGETKYGFSVNVPEVFAYARSVMISERVKGITLTQMETLIEGRNLMKKYGSMDIVLAKEGNEKAKIAEKAVKIEGLLKEMGYTDIDIEGLISFNMGNIYEIILEHLFYQLFTADLYHADLHKSNIMITPDKKIYLIDFGIIGQLDSAEKKAGMDIIYNVFKGDDGLLIEAVERFIGETFAPDKKILIVDKLGDFSDLEFSEQISAKLKILLDFVDEAARDRQKKYRFDTFVTAVSRSSYLIKGAFGRFQGLLAEYKGTEVISSGNGAYFGESKDKGIKKKIDKEIKDIAEDVGQSRFRIIRQGTENLGWYKMEKGKRKYDRNITGNFSEADKYSAIVNKRMDEIIKDYPGLAQYDVWIVKSDISGHSGASRKRIYMPIDILKMAEQNLDYNKRIIEDFIKHEYLESLRDGRGRPRYSHDQVVAMLGKKFHERVHKMYREYVISGLMEEVRDKEGVEELKAELDKILKMVQKGEEITLDEIDTKALFLSIMRGAKPEFEQKVCRLLNLVFGKDYKYTRGRIGARICYAISKLKTKKDDRKNMLYDMAKMRQKDATNRFVETVRKNATQERKRVLVLDTDIGNMTEIGINELLKQVKEVSILLGEIEFIAGTGEKLPGLIDDKINELTSAGKINRSNIDVVVVTRRNKKDFDGTYKITRVNDAKLKDSASYVPILELLTFALKINLENEDEALREELRKIYNEITGNELKELTKELMNNIKKGDFAIPLPPTKRISSEFYNESIEILKSA